MRSKCCLVSATEVTSPLASALDISAAVLLIIPLRPIFVGLGNVVLLGRAHQIALDQV